MHWNFKHTLYPLNKFSKILCPKKKKTILSGIKWAGGVPSVTTNYWSGLLLLTKVTKQAKRGAKKRKRETERRAEEDEGCVLELDGNVFHLARIADAGGGRRAADAALPQIFPAEDVGRQTGLHSNGFCSLGNCPPSSQRHHRSFQHHPRLLQLPQTLIPGQVPSHISFISLYKFDVELLILWSWDGMNGLTILFFQL